MIDKVEIERQLAAKRVVHFLENQAGIDLLPAAASRFLTVVHANTGYYFRMIGKGRSRYVYEIIQPDFDLGLVLKLGNKLSNEREREFTRRYPEDWARIYGWFDYATISERASMVAGFDDPRILPKEFQARVAELAKRYEAISDVGFIDERIVLVGSSVRLK